MTEFPHTGAGTWALLDLQPAVCLVVDLRSGQALYRNLAARQLPLDTGAGAAGDFYASDASQCRIEPHELARHVMTAASCEGTELYWHTPQGRFAFKAFCRPLPDAAPGLAVLSFLDLTREKQVEDELRQALEARDEFFSIATHELKDPLFSLQLSMQLLRRTAQKRGGLPPHVVEHLDVGERQAVRLGLLIENLLEVARIMNRRVRLEVEAIDLCALVHDTVGRFQAQAAGARTPLRAETTSTLIVYGDRLKLEQVVGNLVSNALKYGGGRDVVVRVRAENDSAVVEVQDQGAGIAPEHQELIFRRFERASHDHRRDSLGLGLYIVQSFVEAHGGSIGVTSAPGAGSTFTVLLPRLRLSDTAHSDLAPASRGE